MIETLYAWEATYRCDDEESFTTDTFIYMLPTTILSEAAKLIEAELGWHATLFSLKRTDI